MHQRHVAVLLLIAASACSVKFPLHSAFVTDFGWVAQETSVRQEPLAVADDAEPLQVQLDVHGESGAVVWTIADPDGVVRFRCRAEAAQQLQHTCALPSSPGTWTVRRAYEDFTGHQHFTVTACSPEQVEVRLGLARK